MKHTNFDPIIERLREIETEELKQAVLAHGGLYRIDEEHRPAITFPSSNHSDTAEDVEIIQISVNDAGELCLTGRPYGPFGDSGPEIEYDLDDLPLGQLSFIINEIPETETVKDVSRNIVVEINTVKLTDLQRIRKDACDRIKAIMQRHDIDEIYATDIDEGSSPVIEQDPFDANNTRTLGSISLEDGKLTFSASNCSDSIDYDEDFINTDALVDVAEWLEENEDQLEGNDDE